MGIRKHFWKTKKSLQLDFVMVAQHQKCIYKIKILILSVKEF